MPSTAFGPRLMVSALFPTVLVISLSGCAGAIISSDAPTAALTGISGRVHGGQQAVAGAVVQLMEPGTTGYGSAPSLIVAAVAVSDADGNFTLPRPYTCPANSGLVYILTSGGNAGAGVNTAIAEAAILGNCSSLTASTFVDITEVTTVAAAYALAPFAVVTAPLVAGGPQTANIGTSSTNLQGLYNAAGPAFNLANNATGFAHVTGDVAGIVPPSSELNSLADIIAACVNQGTPNNAAGNCAALFTATTPTGGLTPTDTFQAAIQMAQNPGSNISTLYNLIATNAPFQPTLGAVPNDFSLALGYNGGALTLGGGNVSVAIDATGNAWISTGSFNAAVHCLTEITPTGTYPGGSAVATTSGFDCANLSNPVGIAIDQSGYIWVANNGATDLLKFNPDATASLNATITAPSFNGVNALAFDPSSNVWVANFGSAYLTKITTANTEATNSPFPVGGEGVDVAVGPLAVWSTNVQNDYLFRIDLTTFAVGSIQIGGSVGDVAIDHANNAWLAVTGNGSIFKITNALGYSNTPNGGFIVSGTRTQNVIVDGLGNVFSGAVNNSSNTSMGTLLEYSNSAALLSPGLGFTGSNVIPAGPGVPGGIAIDGSGNIWISGTTASRSVPLYVAEIIGIAAPVVTPKAPATANNTLGTRPQPVTPH